MFLFGARQTGKSTLLKERFKGAVYYDLLKPNVRRAFKQNPDSLWEALQDKPAGTLVIVDEIQKVPDEKRRARAIEYLEEIKNEGKRDFRF